MKLIWNLFIVASFSGIVLSIATANVSATLWAFAAFVETIFIRLNLVK